MAVSPRTVTGTLKDAFGDLLASTSFDIVPRGMTGQGGAGIVPNRVTVTSDGSGNVSFDLMPGNYDGYVEALNGAMTPRIWKFPIALTEDGSTVLSEIITATPVEITPEALAAAEAARDDAEAAYAAVVAASTQTLISRDPAEDAFTARDSYNATPTNDAAKIQATIDAGAANGFADLRTGGLGLSVSSGLRYTNAGVEYVSGADAAIVAAPSATIDALLAPSVWDLDAASYPAAAYADKFRGRKSNIAINGNVTNGATVDYGYVNTGFGGIEFGFKIKNVSGVGYALLSQNSAEDASTTGNQILNYMIGHSVENPAGTPMPTGFLFGEDYNGKTTDGVGFGLHSYATETAVQVGSAQGWLLTFGRHALTDDGVVFKHANRSWAYGTIIDEYGYGHDAGQTSFVGIDLGRATNTDAGDIGSIGGVVLARADAGDTASYTYDAIRFGNSGAAVGKAVVIADMHLHGDGSSAITRGVVQIADSGDTEATGTIHDLVMTGGYTNQTMSSPFELLSPYIKAHHISEGKRLTWTGRNDRGYLVKNLDSLLGAADVTKYSLGMSKTSIAAATPTAFASVTLGVNSATAIEVEVLIQNPDANVMRSKRWIVGAQRHSSGSAPTLGTVTQVWDTGSVSNNSGLRTCSDLTLTAAASGDLITLSVSASFTGSSAPTSYRANWTVKGQGFTPSSGVIDVAVV